MDQPQHRAPLVLVGPSLPIKDEKAAKQAKAFAMWLGCATQQEIAKAVSVDHSTLPGWEDEFVKTSAGEDFTNSRDFTPPLYNVWKRHNLPPAGRYSVFPALPHV